MVLLGTSPRRLRERRVQTVKTVIKTVFLIALWNGAVIGGGWFGKTLVRLSQTSDHPWIYFLIWMNVGCLLLLGLIAVTVHLTMPKPDEPRGPLDRYAP